MSTPLPDTQPAGETLETDDESGIGGDEPFCQHGNLLWSEDCDECIAESWALSNAITRAIREGKVNRNE